MSVMDAIMAQCRNTALIMGVIALIGLLLQKKNATEVVSGTLKTVIGFMVFTIGSNAMSAVVNNFSTIFNLAFGIEGVTTQVEVATALALDTYGTEVAMVFVLGFIFNLIVAKFTRFKAIFLTGQHFLYFACVLALVFIAHDCPFWVTTIGGGLMLGFFGAAMPTLCQSYMNKIVGADNLASGHVNTIDYWFSGRIGKMISRVSPQKQKDSSEMKMPAFFQLFRDFVFSVALFMIVLFYVAVIAAACNGHLPEVREMAGADIWFIYPFLQGLQFAAGMSVLIYGVRQFIAEITAAFVGISEKYIPDAKPAVDCPAIFPFAPTAVLVGFVGSLLGGLFAMLLMVVFKSPTIMIPAAGICFFSGGTCGVFGNAYGGWKGAFVGSFIVGIALCALPLILYPAFSALGIAGASFPNVDYNIIGAILDGILGLFTFGG